MSNRDPFVKFDNVNDMLDGDQAYIEEFCEAAIVSFSTFREEYREHVKNRNLENLRMAGHRIKPVAQMMEVHPLLEEYDRAKELIDGNVDSAKIEDTIETMDTICEKVIAAFRKKINKPAF